MCFSGTRCEKNTNTHHQNRRIESGQRCGPTSLVEEVNTHLKCSPFGAYNFIIRLYFFHSASSSDTRKCTGGCVASANFYICLRSRSGLRARINISVGTIWLFFRSLMTLLSKRRAIASVMIEERRRDEERTKRIRNCSRRRRRCVFVKYYSAFS